MKTPSDSNEPLLQSLADEVSDLPLLAAQEARKSHAMCMKQRRQVSLAIGVLFFGMCLSLILRERNVGADFAANHPPTDFPSPPSLQRSKYVTVRTMEQARKEPLPLPDGITRDQAKVLIAARGLPLLLVRDRAGKVARIHIIER